MTERARTDSSNNAASLPWRLMVLALCRKPTLPEPQRPGPVRRFLRSTTREAAMHPALSFPMRWCEPTHLLGRLGASWADR